MLKKITSKSLIDDSRPTAEDLIEAYALSDAIVETVREPLLILNGELRVVRANESFYKTFKFTKKETLNKPLYKIGNKQWDIPLLRGLLSDILPNKTTLKGFEVEHKFKTVGKKLMVLNARQILLDGHGTKLILLAMEDITERRNLERQRDALVGSAGHELKTPLTSIKAYTQLLLKNPGKKSTEYLKKIDSKINVLSKLVDDILNMSKMGAGQMKTIKEEFSINECINSVVEDLKSYSENHEIKKEGSFDGRVIGDSKLICQVLINLILNAVKYSPDSKIITVRTKVVNDMLQVAVKDRGMGVPKKDQKHIFEPFYRTENKKKERIPGFGLGLYISSEIISSHGGTLQVESDGKNGSTFFFSLPIKA